MQPAMARAGRGTTERWPALVASALAAGVALLLLLSRDAPARTVHVAGMVGLVSTDGSGLVVHGRACEGAGSYRDLVAGAHVLITDRGGATVARTTLGAGSLHAPGECLFRWAADIPARGPSFAVTVGQQDPATYTLDQMKQGPIIVVGRG